MRFLWVIFWFFTTCIKGSLPADVERIVLRLSAKFVYWPHYGGGEWGWFYPKWASERQRYFRDSISITSNSENLMEFFIFLGPPHIGIVW